MVKTRMKTEILRIAIILPFALEQGDLLTSYNGNEITYDEMGNPLSYYSGWRRYTFTWEGRNLIGANRKTIGMEISRFSLNGGLYA